MPDQALLEATEVFLGNPFARTPGDLAAARKALGPAAVATELSRLIRSSEIALAKNLVLAAGHAQATATADPTQVLREDMLPQPLARKLPRPRGEYLRLVMAAGRCFQTLRGIRGSSELMQKARRDTWAACFGDSLRLALDLERVIRDHDILILGETGTGKETLAHAVQTATPGDDTGRPAATSAINAAAIPDTLVESELFGHEKGAFTGATDHRVGRLRTADGGSFFLDEVGDLPQTTQVKLLRVIETNEVFPVGSDKSYAVDVRYIAATHKDLIGLVEDRLFRRDLYERLAGNILTIPPLRDRPEDIVEIGRYFLGSYATRSRVELPDHLEGWLTSTEARSYHWPGNVRELQNVLRNLLLGLAPQIASRHPPAGSSTNHLASTDGIPASIASGAASFQEVGDWYIRRVLDTHEGNLTQAARSLGLDRSTIRRRLKSP
jgi:two-component system response regulator HydG